MVELVGGKGKKTENVDRLFDEARPISTDFEFDKKTAAVFDDMVSRSVPFYNEMQRMISEIAGDFAPAGTNLYDLGCATGTTMVALDTSVDPSVRFIGVDNSDEMLEKAREKMRTHNTARPVELVNGDLHKFQDFQNASVVALVLTLQFIRPLQREKVIQNIYDGLNENGCLILVEKLTVDDSLLNRLFINYYYDYKRRLGYSETEITRKREALENVLIPYRFDENREMLWNSGFRRVEEFFRWYNFSAMIAVK